MISIWYHPIIIGLLVVFCCCNWSEYCSDISVYLSTSLEINQHQIGFIESCASFPLWYHLCKREDWLKVHVLLICARRWTCWFDEKRLKKAILSASKVKQVYWCWEEESQLLSWEGRRNGKAYKSCQAVFSIWLKLNWLISFHRNGILVHSTQFAMSMYQHKIYCFWRQSRKYLYGALTQKGWSVVARIKALI